jgi:predicted deacylase
MCRFLTFVTQEDKQMAQDVSFSVRNNNGDAVQVSAWRYSGNGSGPTVHLQAGVHADEIAGMLVLHLLMHKLEIALAQGRLNGSVTVVPQANPPGITSTAGSTNRPPWPNPRPTSRNGKRNWCSSRPRQT